MKDFGNGEYLSKFKFGRLRFEITLNSWVIPCSLTIAKAAVSIHILCFGISFFYKKHHHNYW